MQEKICKCGHSKLDHKEKPQSKLSGIGECKKCKCSDYLNRKLPNKFSVLSLGVGFVAIGFFILTSLMLYSLGSEAGWNKPITLNVSSVITIAISVFILGIIIIFNSTLFDYFKERKRKEYPIE